MTHQEHSNDYNDLVELLAENGFDGMAQAVEILMNEAMKLERSDVLQAAPYQRTDARRGYANGYKPKTVRSRLGALELQVPQARGVEFYPSTLERGERSERALKLAVAEMYVQGVSTRKVAVFRSPRAGSELFCLYTTDLQATPRWVPEMLVLAAVSFEEFDTCLKSGSCSACKPAKNASMAKLFQRNHLWHPAK